MNNKLDCAIIRDLLPSYADGLTSDETNKAVEAHLTECADCAAVLRRMKEPEAQESAPGTEIDYLKKVRSRSKRSALLTGIALTLAVLAALFIRVFCFGSEIGMDGIGCVTAVGGRTVSVSGALTDSSRGVVRSAASEENGVVRIRVYTAPRTFFNSTKLSVSYTALNKVKQVTISDQIVWENGTEIESKTAKLFEASNPYVGNMPANAKIADILCVSTHLGPFTNELQTAQEPYGWTIKLKTPIAQKYVSAARDIMTADSYAMLAVIGNLGSVTWTYNVNAVSQSYTVTAQNASDYSGKDIKRCDSSVSELQKLLSSLSIMSSSLRAAPDDGTFYLCIKKDCDTAVFQMELTYYLDGKIVATRGAGNADNSVLAKGSTTIFDFLPADFPDGSSPMELSDLSFDLTVVGKSGQRTVVCKGWPVQAMYGYTASYTLTGDFKNGFNLTDS